MTFMLEEIFEQPTVIERCKKSNSEAIAEITDVLNRTRIDSVVVAARGTSDHAGVFGKYVIEYMKGVPVALAAPSIVTVYGRALNLRNSLVIGISQSGMAADVLEVIKEANHQGAVTLSITNAPDSPLASASKFHLYLDAGVEKSVAATKTFISQIYILARLAAEWAKDSHLKSELDMVPGNVYEILNTSNHIREKVQRFRYMNECIVLSRGVNYSIALESALKIQETSYVRAKAYSTADFYHGPLAMIEKDMPVIIYAPKGPCLQDTVNTARVLKEKEAELIVVSNHRQILDMGECAFAIPETTNDIISPFFNVVVAQLFACHLAVVKGINPDSPRNLNKVTVTK